MSEEISREEIAALLARGSEEQINTVVAALSAEPCSDAISRTDVIDAIGSWLDSGEWQYTNATEYLKKRVNGLPSVHAEITHESAIDFLRNEGWLQEHDRILSGCDNCENCKIATKAYFDGQQYVEEHVYMPMIEDIKADIAEDLSNAEKESKQTQDDVDTGICIGLQMALDTINQYKAESEESCDTCKHRTESWDSDACDGCCGNHSGLSHRKARAWNEYSKSLL